MLDREQCDLGDADDVAAPPRRRSPHADVLVHAAARFDQATLADVELETWRRVQAVNVEAAVLLAQAFAPGMAERGWGRIVHIVSDTIWQPAAPRAARLRDQQGGAGRRSPARWRAALGADGITVNAVAPGLTRTPAAEAGIPQAAFEDVAARQARAAPLVPDDVAGTVAFLCTDAAAAITGQTLNVDGGLIFH